MQINLLHKFTYFVLKKKKGWWWWCRIVVVVVFKRNFIIHTTECLTMIYYLFVEQRIKFNLV